MKLLKRIVLTMLFLLALTAPALSLAESDYEEGVGWEFRDGVLTITANGGMEDFFDNERDQNGSFRYQHDGYDVKTVVIGKNVTKFKMFVLGEEFFPTSMRIEEGNSVFSVIDGWLVNLQTKTLICATDLSRFLWIPVARKIPDFVEKIGTDAFYPLNLLKQIQFPDSVIEIGQKAFYSCEGLETLQLPPNLKTIGRSAFGYCHSLKKVVLGSKVETIDEYAFSSCYNLERINLQDTRVTVLPEDVVSYTSLKNVVLPETLRLVETDAFHACRLLYAITICSDDIVIQNGAFSVCDRIRKLIFTKGVPKYLGADLFDSNGETPDGKHFLSNHYESEGKAIPYPTLYYTAEYAAEWAPNGETEWNGYPIKQLTEKEENSLRSELNSQVSAQTSLFIDDDYEEGNGWIFDHGTLLLTRNGGLKDFASNEMNDNFEYQYRHFPSEVETIIIGKAVSQISPIISYGFWYCTPNEIKIDTGNPYFINDNEWIVQTQTGTLLGPENLASFSKTVNLDTLPNNIRIIGEYAFDLYYLPNWYSTESIAKFEQVVFPDNLIAISKEAFYSCGELTWLDLPPSLISIGDSAFQYCWKLKEAKLGAVRSIGSEAFRDCINLTSINLGDTRITKLREFVFGDCKSLTTMILPETLETIEPGAFYECESLRTVVVQSDHITVQSNAFDDCVGLNYIFFIKGIPAAFGESLMGESEATSDGRYYISDYFMTEYQPIPYPTLFYTAEYADEWAPNGETTWNGYPIQQISQDVIDAVLAQARGEKQPEFSSRPVPASAGTGSSLQLSEDETFWSRVVFVSAFTIDVIIVALLVSMRDVWKKRRS